MQEIADWLESLGLCQYARQFAENDIDFSILGELTDQDLEKIGIASLGHRRKLIRAITNLENEKAASALGVPPSKPSLDAAERRHITVMFADLVGSTALSSRMDPEDLREIVTAYHRCVVKTVARFDGFVAQHMGDGALVYFGYPQAHEDDTERAVRAGLELVTTVSDLKIDVKIKVSLQSRVGIATGLAVVGDVIGLGSHEQSIVGETPNLAARLQVLAEPNCVVISESTRKLVDGLFEFGDLGAKDIKGFGRPVRAWRVLRPISAESRFEALHSSGLTDLVGRDEELEILLRRWSNAKSDEGQAILLSGEPGIGKSRLTAAMLDRLAKEPHTRLRYFCSPQHTNSAFYPIISQMERAAGFTNVDSGQVRLDKLDALLAQSSTSAHDAALFAEMLSLTNDGRYPAVELTPQQRREKTLGALFAQVDLFARTNPVLMIFEDAHWADPTSLEAVDRAVGRIANRRVLMVITFRPEFEPPWIGQPHVTALTINRLTRRQADSMIDRLAGNEALPPGIRQDIIERTDGIPLFVEEMTKAVLEAENQGSVEHAIAATPSPTMTVPATLHASLMARLDRLGSAKEIAQIAAVIGREFSHALLAAVARKPEADLESALKRLVTAGLLFRQGVLPHTTFLFKHALVSDAAYGTLLREQRRALHARIAETLVRESVDIAENQPEVLARHYSAAGQIEKAAALWGKAGQRSLERSALVEAIEQFKRALAELATMPGTPALRREEIKLQLALTNSLMHVKGHAAQETMEAVERARVLIARAEESGEPPEDPLLLFSVLYGFWVGNYIASNGGVIRDLADKFLSLAKKQAATAPLMIGHRMVGTSMVHTGDLAQGREHLDQAIALYDPSAHRALATKFSQNDRVASLVRRSQALWSLGYPEAAMTDVDHALEEAREIGHVASLAVALWGQCWISIDCGRYTAADKLIDDLAELADEKRVPFWKANAVLYRGWLYALSGKAIDAVNTITSAAAVLQSAGGFLHSPVLFRYLANAHAQLGQFDEAWRRIDEAMKATERTKETWCEAEVNRAAGEIALLSPEADTAKAEKYFERALQVARAQQAKSWELRAAMSMARLWRDQGKRAEARDILAPVYCWFTEGFDTLDLKEAKALLDELPRQRV
jgi:class 3 adenylate cyclase/predicted ATPase